ESILVDACNPSAICPGSSEGQNEMVRFRTGPTPIALNELEADWPNNSWQGLIQDATTAQITAELNLTIESCGWLLEPPGGIIPAGSGVLLVTSTAMCTAANSFANLGDTLYIIFQDGNNSSGHFANSPASGQPISPTPPAGNSTRTLVLTYLPTNCSDTATYVRELLVNNLGSYGGISGENDGSTVQFSWPGTPTVTYVNFGCQAPIVPVGVQASSSGDLCGGGTVNITGVVTGAFDAAEWTGGTGTFGDASALETTYTAGPNETGDVTLTLCITGPCSDPICTTLVIPAGDAPVVTITTDGPTAICPGEQLTLTGSGADTYVWSTSEETPSILVDAPGTYSVTGTNACGDATASIEVTASPGPTVVITGDTVLCSGATVVLTASGADTYAWSTAETGASITVNSAGVYSVTGTNSCGQVTATVNVVSGEQAVATITGNGPLCPGGTLVLTATGGGSYLWSTNDTTPTITVDEAGTYAVVVDNGCATATASVDISEVIIDASFAASVTVGEGPLTVQFTNASTPSGANALWVFGDGTTSNLSSPAHTFTDPGVYTVVLTVTDQGCTATASLAITVLAEPIEESSIEVPNVFSPNGDGRNDVLQLTSSGIISMSMEIFNRWGQEVMTLTSTNQVWNARTGSGGNVPDGTYFYTLVAQGSDGRTHELRGTITVLR
ncbi:MAG: gliding motility-associated C-terminal domain-containing protein, partial [Flavobacteriales bacterium]|nr:gliding motility-associated C-terminal domain-containing protein [Flavobacteriales bacterium]